MDTKYIGMDVHKETVSITVMNSAGKLVIESILETEAMTLLQFVQGLCVPSRLRTKANWIKGTTGDNIGKALRAPTPDVSSITSRTSVRKSSRQPRQQSGALRCGLRLRRRRSHRRHAASQPLRNHLHAGRTDSP